MKRLIAGAPTALLVGSVGGFGRHVATSGPGLRDSPTPFPVGENSTAKIVYALGDARLPAFNWTYDTNRGAGASSPAASVTRVCGIPSRTPSLRSGQFSRRLPPEAYDA